MSSATIGHIEPCDETRRAGEPLRLIMMGLAADSIAWLFQLPEFAPPHPTLRAVSGH